MRDSGNGAEGQDENVPAAHLFGKLATYKGGLPVFQGMAAIVEHPALVRGCHLNLHRDHNPMLIEMVDKVCSGVHGRVETL